MKKLLIALPLVLIMILTMIPVMADENCKAVNVTVNVRTWNNPSDVGKGSPVAELSVNKAPKTEEITDKDAFTAWIKKAALDLAMPRPHNRVPVDSWKAVIEEEVVPMPKTGGDQAYCQTQATLSYTVDVFPNCETEEKETTETTCPVLCDIITIEAVNIADGKVVAEKGYGVKNKNNPSFNGMMKHFTGSVLDLGKYRIVENWFGQPWIDYPSLLEKCTITVRVLPLEQKVNVIHKLMTCCENIDGTKSYSVWKSFVEQNQTVDFVDYHSKLVFDHSKAKEFAKTRLERINANDFVFIDAAFDDGIRLDNYMTGELFDIVDGKPVPAGEIKNAELPTIVLIYHHSDCVEQEEKVDNATVNAGNATTTNTPAAQQLPATGAKDVTAFFMSAVALLGLGIFFAKKH